MTDLIFAYCIQWYRASMYCNKTNDYSRIDDMMWFDGLMIAYFGYEFIEYIWDTI